MAIQAPSYIDVISHIPAGATLTIPEVSWEDYLELLNDLGEGYGVRISYDTGNLQIMSPSVNHEPYKDLLLLIAFSTARELKMPFASRGSLTLKQKSLSMAAEPDTCFFIANAARLKGRNSEDDNDIVPPDIVVEVDLTNSSVGKMRFYARLGVTEIWRYNGTEFKIYQLIEGRYINAEISPTFPILSAESLLRFLEMGKTEEQIEVVSSFEDWLRDQRKTTDR